MTLDPRLLTQNITPDLMSSISRGIQAGQAIRQAPIIEAMQKQRLAQQQRMTAQPRFIGTPQRTTQDGQNFLTGLVQTPQGDIIQRSVPIQGEFVSQLGETAEEEEARRIREAREKAGISTRAEGEKVTVTGKKKRLQSAIDTGLDATESINDIGRSLELLNQIGTGKQKAVLLAAKERLGIQAADEAELKSLLGRAVIDNLKSSYGGNPTEGEREALAEIETSFSQQGEVNKRLLNRNLSRLERRISRGISAANKEGDFFALERLEIVKANIDQLREIGLAEKPAGAPEKKDFDLEYDPATGTFK